MEPPLKRLRLEQAESRQSITYDSDDYSGLCDDEDMALDVDEDVDEDVEEGGDEIAYQEDPDAQLEQKRARLDLKLKSKFEAIFEKYGRDFTGIGDEIDLETGEIVVNNGHLLEMENERDDGTARPSLLEAFTQDAQEALDFTEVKDNELDEIHDSHVKLEDMEEDDMILFQGAGMPSFRPTTPPARLIALQESPLHLHEDSRTITPSKHLYPSENEIMAQFGQELGPEIARYVSQKRIQDDTTVEPAWRTPGLPLATPGRRPILKSILFQPDIDRSPSPKGSSSVWAPKRPRGRPRRDGADADAVFRGERIIRDRTWYSSGYVSTTVTKQRTERVGQSQARSSMSVPLNETPSGGKIITARSAWAQSSQFNAINKYLVDSVSDREPDSADEQVAQFYKPRRWSNPVLTTSQGTSSNLNLQHVTSELKRKDGPLSSSGVKGTLNGPPKRVPFTPEDDKMLLEWVEEALAKGFPLWSPTHWKMLAERNPRHSYGSWLHRYRKWFWQKGVVPDLAEEDSRRNSKDRTDASEVVRQIIIISDSDSESEDLSSLAGSPSEILQSDPRFDSKSFRSASPPRNPGEFSRTNPLGTATVFDPALDPALFELLNKTEGSASPGLQLSEPNQKSHSPATAINTESDISSQISNNIPKVTGSSLRSGPQIVVPEAEGSPFLSGRDNGRTAVADSIDAGADQSEMDKVKIKNGDISFQTASSSENVTKVTSHNTIERGAQVSSSIPNSSADADAQAQLSSAIQSPLHTRAKSPVVQTEEQFSYDCFDAAYGFSDEEEVVDIVSLKPRDPFRLQTANTQTSRNSVKAQRIDTTAEDSTFFHQTTTDREILRSSPFARNQSPISISGSPLVDDLSELERKHINLKPSTPAHPVSDSNRTLSEILGFENFEESSQDKLKTGRLKEIIKGPLDDLKPSPARNSTPRGRTTMSMTRASILKRNMGKSPGSAMIETPGVSLKGCGEKGFRCGKDFCFKCMAD